MAIGLIGAGKMGTALAKNITAALPDQPLLVAEPNDAAWQHFANTLSSPSHIQRVDCIHDLVSRVHTIILAVKPQHIPDVLTVIGRLTQPTRVISIAAGVTIRRIASSLGEQARIIRVMPNTPLLIGEGFSAFTLASNCLPEDEIFVNRIFSNSPRIFAGLGSIARPVEEEKLDAITAVSGSGPAYVFHFVHAWIQEAENLGLTPELAREAVLHTIHGALAMMREHPERPPLQLARDVKSPGGTTEAACRVLEEKNWENIFRQAIRAAEERSQQLSSN
ncbi:MAG: pyrroline-5-carboxylate reductase [Methylacidiphilales bacterium]|nr:pyrroline-5-carboxylate reductase [Candidatus Methylacidiphilales bacterium]MDW8349913.1 pyrroline-5-carboxylate reductase [Verrucomicrobiae bacterium]